MFLSVWEISSYSGQSLTGAHPHINDPHSIIYSKTIILKTNNFPQQGLEETESTLLSESAGSLKLWITILFLFSPRHGSVTRPKQHIKYKEQEVIRLTRVQAEVRKQHLTSLFTIVSTWMSSAEGVKRAAALLPMLGPPLVQAASHPSQFK